MLGISKALAEDLEARGYSEADVARIFGPKAHAGELRVIYDRGNGDRTSPLPSSRHAYYYGAKNWVAVAIADDPAQPSDQLIEVPADIQEHARHDRTAVWCRKGGRDTMNSSCRNAAALISKGWKYEGLADEDRLRAVAEARPYPPPVPPTPAPASEPTQAAAVPSKRK